MNKGKRIEAVPRMNEGNLCLTRSRFAENKNTLSKTRRHPVMDKGKEYRLSHNVFGKTWVDLILTQRVGLMINYRLWSVSPDKHVLVISQVQGIYSI